MHQAFTQLHQLLHPGVRSSQSLTSERYFWLHVHRDISCWTRSCTPCQTAKIHQHICAPILYIQIPQDSFSHVHIDIIGPLPPSQGATHLLTTDDMTTKWPEDLPMSSITADECTRKFTLGWVAHFGIPQDITSDHRHQFMSSLWTQLASTLGISLQCITAYHPQANGLVKHFHRYLKTALQACLSGANWCDKLPWVLLTPNHPKTRHACLSCISNSSKPTFASQLPCESSSTPVHRCSFLSQAPLHALSLVALSGPTNCNQRLPQDHRLFTD